MTRGREGQVGGGNGGKVQTGKKINERIDPV